MAEIPEKYNNSDKKPIANGNTPYPWQGAMVLLVEDNLANQQLGMVVLKKFGIQVDVVDNGLKALELLKSKSYDMVFMDLQMPEMDGLEATVEIRTPESGVLNSDIPIVALTANAFNSDKKKCFEVGMNDYISKPFIPDTIKEVLEKYLTNNTQTGPRSEQLPVQKDENNKKAEAKGPTGYDDLPVHDHDAFMDRIMNDQKLMSIVLDGFLRDMPQQVAKLKDLILMGDTKAAGRQSHVIKGAAANIGGESLRSISLLLELAGNEGRLNEMKEQMSTLEIEFEKLTAILKGYLKDSEATSEVEV